MAVRSISVGGSAAADTTTNFLSEEIKTPIRLIALLFLWSGATIDDTVSIFTTLSAEPRSEPAAGDPPVLVALRMRPCVAAGGSMSVPILKRELVKPPLRVALSYFNAHPTETRMVNAIIFYDDTARE